MSPNPSSAKSTAKPVEAVVKDIRRATRWHFSADDKIRIVPEVLRGEESIASFERATQSQHNRIGLMHLRA